MTLEEILHRGHLRGNPVYTAWFLKFRGKYFFSTKVHIYLSIFEFILYLQWYKQKDKTHLFQKLVLNKYVQSQHTNGNYLVWF